MAAQQLCFFKFDRPLIDLLGVDFFRRAPSQPGVYIFRGEARRVLYVGQSQNLRTRLAYYKNAQPEREPRRIIRLVHQTRAIELETCESPQAAQAREVELIQEHRPRYNVQHALSRTYSFFALRAENDALRLLLLMDQPDTQNQLVIGAFKNRGLCRRALFCIRRSLWSRAHSPKDVFDLPISALDRTRLNEVPLDPQEKENVLQLLTGTSRDFLAHTEALIQHAPEPFLRAIFERDLQTLLEFFELAVRMRQLREQFGALLPQHEIDRVATRTRKPKRTRLA